MHLPKAPRIVHAIPLNPKQSLVCHLDRHHMESLFQLVCQKTVAASMIGVGVQSDCEHDCTVFSPTVSIAIRSGEQYATLVNVGYSTRVSTFGLDVRECLLLWLRRQFLDYVVLTCDLGPLLLQYTFGLHLMIITTG